METPHAKISAIQYLINLFITYLHITIKKAEAIK